MEGRRKEFATLLCISATNEERAAPDVVDVDRITFLKSVHEMVDKEGSVSSHRTVAVEVPRCNTPIRVPSSGFHTSGCPPLIIACTSKTAGHAKNTTCCSVMTKSCIITGCGRSIGQLSLMLASPSAT